MTYRRNSDSSIGSSRWRCKHRDTLLACGIPLSIIDSDKALVYLLLHGDELSTGWNTNFINDKQAFDLLTFLKTELPNSLGYDIVNVLEKRLTKNA